jgi:hypothetical protein
MKWYRYVPLVCLEDGDRTVSSQILVTTYQIIRRQKRRNFNKSVPDDEDRRSLPG